MKIAIRLFVIGVILGNLAMIFGQDSDDEEIEVDWAEALANYVQTPSGPIIGTTTQILALYVKTFLGIPYARPPVGNLRFTRTIPVDPWSEALNATTMPLACIQYTTYPYPWYDFEPEKSEDCLYLNIWTPIDAAPGTNKSVMFYIHGGESFGSNRKDVYDGRALAALGDVIVVIPNYRLNLFGFLTSATRDLPATRGLLATDHVILNHGQVTWTTPELAPTSPNYHTTPTRGRFSSRQI
ncbi:acetylcholinesterase [Trichonephila clavipes]|nr:acetylcholinesterase [Trichonephila clavipes]